MFAAPNSFITRKGGFPVITLTIASTTTDYNVFTAAGSPATAKVVNVTINSAVQVNASTTAAYAFSFGTGWATGTIINLTNLGTIAGKGGAGGAAGNPGSSGAAGGAALRAQSVDGLTINVTNGSGTINGGGGGGGGGGTSYGISAGPCCSTINTTGAGGAGGAGYGANAAASGAAGSSTPLDGQQIIVSTGGAGGAGGAAGASGSSGSAGEPAKNQGPFSSLPGGAGGSGGAAGAAVVGNAYITFISNGTRNGAIT